jgi:poly-gamma-glutamate capsule biosynthesis protein CapA/YwtB (metallophosphatase superfamily)
MAFSLAAVGQALIKRDVSAAAALIDKVKAADIAFTNLEGAIAGRHGGWPMKDSKSGGMPPGVLDNLRQMGFRLLSLANNHAADLGPGGILSSIEEASTRGFTVAGTGANAASAALPGIAECNGRRVALVAIDSGPWGDHVYAGATRPGVNRLKVTRRVGLPAELVTQLVQAAASAGHAQRSNTRVAVGFQKPAPRGAIDFFGVPIEPAAGPCERWAIDEADLARHVAVVRKAAAECDLVVVYLHNHHWPADWMYPPAWMREAAARLLAAGGDVFISHGAPVLQGLELIGGKPAAYGLGNFIFHSVNRKIRSFPEVWRSALLTFRWEERRLTAIEATALSLGDPATHDDPESLRDVPQLWTGPEARRYLEAWVARGFVPAHTWKIDEQGARLDLRNA